MESPSARHQSIVFELGYAIGSHIKKNKGNCRVHPDPFEVLSPFTQNRDKKETLEVYESVGVKEYWIVDPFEDKVCVYHLKNTTTSEPPQYSLPDSYRFADKIPVGAFPGLTIELSGV